MSKKEKILERIMECPCRKDIRIDEIITLAQQMGFRIKEGSNHTLICNPGTNHNIPFPRHDKTVKEYLVKEFQDLIREVERMGE